MKKIPFLIVFLLTVSFLHAQNKTKIGIYTEGSWFMPGKLSDYSRSFKNGFGAGVGFYASTPIWRKLSGSVGLGYRYKEDKQQIAIPTSNLEGTSSGYSYFGYGSGSGYSHLGDFYWKKFEQHYIVVPLKLRYSIKNNFFVESGVEAAWLLNYNHVNEKTEFDWLIGFGSDKHRLEWSVNYSQGFKDQGIGNLNGTTGVGQIYRNRMLTLKLAYPLWGLK